MRLPTQLLPRNPDAHKGDFGHIFILAGSARFSGAALLCSQAAMRSGAGLVTLGIPKSLNHAVIKIKPREVMTLPLAETREATLSLRALREINNFIKAVDVLVLGPGLGQNKSTQGLIRKIIQRANKPMIVDADGLNALAGHLDLLRFTRILTPHPGEMARLLGIRMEPVRAIALRGSCERNTPRSIKEVQKKRKEIAEKFAKDYKVTLVLKGHHTIVADYKNNLYINKTGNPGMATAGSGDVLTGMIAAFLAQGLDAFAAAKYAVYLHGLAGDLAAKEKTQLGMIASDIIDKIPQAIKKCS